MHNSEVKLKGSVGSEVSTNTILKNVTRIYIICRTSSAVTTVNILLCISTCFVHPQPEILANLSLQNMQCSIKLDGQLPRTSIIVKLCFFLNKATAFIFLIFWKPCIIFLPVHNFALLCVDCITKITTS